MRFLVDECTSKRVAQWLRQEGHEVFSVYEEARGISDEEIIRKAFADNWILITNDRDFSEKVYREKYPHHGIIFMRLKNERSSNKINVLRQLLAIYSDELANSFVVLTESQVRFRKNLSS